MEPLRNFLAGSKHGDFAKLVGISPAYLSQILNGERRPGLDLAFTIEDATGGAVPAQIWRNPQAAE